MEERFLTVEEAAKRINRTATTVRLLIRKGKLQRYSLGIGHATFLRESDVDDLLRLRPV